MNKILMLIIVLIITTNLFCQIDSSKVAFVSYWSIGDSYDFKVSKTTKKWKTGLLTEDEREDYLATFTVIDSTENSYIISWSYENDLGNTYDIPEELLDKFSKYNVTEIKYKTSEVGDLIEILNWQEIAETMSNMFDDMIEFQAVGDKKKKKELENAIQPIKDVYNSQQGVELLVLKELQYFHFPMGVEFDISEPFFYEEELPNVFGGTPIKAKAKLYIENVDFTENFCTIKQEMSLDPEETKKLLNQAFKKMNLDSKAVKKILKTAVFEINDFNTYDYYFYPGIPRKIETRRETIIDIDEEKWKKIDKIIIELIFNE